MGFWLPSAKPRSGLAGSENQKVDGVLLLKRDLLRYDLGMGYDPQSSAAGATIADDEAKRRFEAILIESVVPTYDAVMAELGKTVPADQVFDELRVRHAERVAKSR